jgi:NitT/TauT family transport system substrate-binding protein
LATARAAKDLLAQSFGEWEPIRPRLNLPNAETLAVYRERYGQGIPRRPIAAEEADARRLYAVLAKLGGSELVGKAAELSPGTFYMTSWGG